MDQNIVLICLDSVRKDVFDDVAVRTQRLADVSFDNCRAASSWSTPSHASMISGLLPSEHSVTTHSRSFDSLPRENTIFDDLQGYRTVGISGNMFAGTSFDFDRYFDSFFELYRGNRFPRALYPSKGNYEKSVSGMTSYFVDSIDSDHTIKSFLNGFSGLFCDLTDVSSRILDEGAKPGLRVAQEELQEASQPTFIFVNLMEGHIPYRPARYLESDLYDVPKEWSSDEKNTWELIQNDYDEQYWDRRNQLYRATVDYLDRRIAKFVRSVGDETTVIITADHGDNLGTDVDEGLANHKSSLSEGLLHVPFTIINAPETSEQTGEYLSHLAIPAIIRGLREGYIPDVTRDRIFGELGGMSAGYDPEEEYEYYDRAIRCAYRGDEKIVWDSLGNCATYQLDLTKPNYQHYVSDLDHPPSWATDHFTTDIETFKSEIVDSSDAVDIDDSTAQRLAELGYL